MFTWIQMRIEAAQEGGRDESAKEKRGPEQVIFQSAAVPDALALKIQ